MVKIIQAGCSAVLLLATLVDSFYPLADPEYYDTGDRFDPDVFELQPYESSGHYHYHPPRPPPRLRLVKKWAPPKTSPLQAVQKVFVSKPPTAVGGPAMTDALGAVILALIAQAVGTLFLLLLGKLMMGMKAVLATNALTLGLKLWKHVKKLKKKKKKKKKVAIHGWQKPHKVHSKPVKGHGHKKPHKDQVKLELSTKQLKKLLKLLKKKKKNIDI